MNVVRSSKSAKCMHDVHFHEVADLLQNMDEKFIFQLQ